MSHPLSRAGAGSLFRAALVVLALAAPSPAAADVPVAEVGSSAAIAVHRNTLAWIDDGAASVVLRHPNGRTQPFPASADTVGARTVDAPRAWVDEAVTLLAAP